MRKRTAPFVQIKSETVNNPEVSLRAIGLLAWLLDKPGGWDVRSEAIAKKTKEGREAIRTALHELGAVGHYRIERRRMLNGKFEMGTAVSYDPDPEWAAQYAEYETKPVTMFEQPDGSFKVKRKDGTLTDDGFEGDVSAGQTEDGFLDSGLPGAGDPGSGDPASGDPQDGELGAFVRTHTEDNETDSDRSHSSLSAEVQQPLIDVPAATDGASETRTIGTPEPVETPGDAVAEWWWDSLDPKPMKTGKARPFIAVRNVCRAAREAGWTDRQVADALVGIAKAMPTMAEVDQTLRAIRDGQFTPRYAARRDNVHQMPSAHPDVAKRQAALGG